MAGYLKATEQRFRAELLNLVARPIASLSGGVLTPLEYKSVVFDWVSKLAHRPLPDAELYRRSFGAFPTIVRETLDALPVMTACALRLDEAGDLAAMPDDGTAWADDECDPVDAQWYFDRPTVTRLLSELPGDTRSLLSLGVPSLGRTAMRTMAEVKILDRSKVLQRHSFGLAKVTGPAAVEVVEWDLDEQPYLDRGQADVVVMDPPWYMEHYEAWLHTAVESCRLGGTIAVVLPQVLTNRRSVADRRELLGILKSIGHVSLRPNLLSYATPSFEQAVLDMNRIGFLGRWRRADLALVKLQSRNLPYEFSPVGDIEWGHREIFGRVVRSWGESRGEDGIPVIRPADTAAEYRLSSVSRFYLRASGINLVTSRGGAAVVSRWGRLPMILDLLRDGYSPPVAVKTALPEADWPTQQDLAATLETILRPHGSVTTRTWEM